MKCFLAHTVNSELEDLFEPLSEIARSKILYLQCARNVFESGTERLGKNRKIQERR